MGVDEVLTVSEVAEYLRVNPQTVYRKTKAGQLPAVRIGRAIRFRRSELDQWMKGGQSEMASSRREAGLAMTKEDLPRNDEMP